MANRLNIFLLLFALAGLLYAGGFYPINEPAHSEESMGLNLLELDSDKLPLAFLDQEPNSEFILAQKNCGNQSCAEGECCCLNIETGAQCCRPLGESANCIEACKKSKPC